MKWPTNYYHYRNVRWTRLNWFPWADRQAIFKSAAKPVEIDWLWSALTIAINAAETIKRLVKKCTPD